MSHGYHKKKKNIIKPMALMGWIISIIIKTIIFVTGASGAYCIQIHWSP